MSAPGDVPTKAVSLNHQTLPPSAVRVFKCSRLWVTFFLLPTLSHVSERLLSSSWYYSGKLGNLFGFLFVDLIWKNCTTGGWRAANVIMSPGTYQQSCPNGRILSPPWLLCLLKAQVQVKSSSLWLSLDRDLVTAMRKVTITVVMTQNMMKTIASCAKSWLVHFLGWPYKKAPWGMLGTSLHRHHPGWVLSLHCRSAVGWPQRHRMVMSVLID